MTAPESRAGLDLERAPEVVEAIAHRTSQLVEALGGLDEADLLAPSRLEGWSRLTVACHLRYGAVALERMTHDVLAGRPTAYYPDGRERQRPSTLEPAPGEGARDVVASLATASTTLDETWSARRPDDWGRVAVEPDEHTDLGPVTLGRLAMSRLLEVEVHGTDLDVGLPDWSSTLVGVALPTRLAWLATRRSNHRAVDPTVEGTWVLVATDGPTWLVSVADGHVTSHPVDGGASPPSGAATVEGTSRDLLALLLGRPPRRALHHGGDITLATRFTAAFPGP